MAELPYVRWISRLSRNRILMHFLFWLAVVIFFFFVFGKADPPLRTLLNSIGFLPGHLIFSYSLIYILFPKYVLRGKMIGAVIGLVVILAVSLLYLRIADVYILHYSGWDTIWVVSSFTRSIFALFSVGWIAVTIKLVKYWYIEKEAQERLEREKLIVELQLLKSQLHPHFLFNTLNSLYSLTLEQSPQSPQMVLQLSALLRYILYECNEPFVPLDKEIESIRNYIGLEQLRFRQRLDISLSFTGDIEGKMIAPLLLLPFVENSIKHGIGEQLDTGWINLNLHVDDNTLRFKLVNSRDEQAAAGSHMSGNGHVSSNDHGSGLGLQNVQRRLGLLYANRHSLKLIPEEDTYTVSLTASIHSSTLHHHETQVSFS